MPVLPAQPNYFVPEIFGAEYSIHSHPYIPVGRRVAMQINAARRFQNAVHFQQPNPQKTQKSGGIIILRQASGFNHLKQRLIFVPYLVQPDAMHRLPKPLIRPFFPKKRIIGPTPSILILPRRRRAIPLFVERGIRGDEIHSLAIHPAQNIQIVHFIQRIIQKILFRHTPPSLESADNIRR